MMHKIVYRVLFLLIGVMAHAETVKFDTDVGIQKVCLDGKVWYWSRGSGKVLVPKLLYSNPKEISSTIPTHISQADCK